MVMEVENKEINEQIIRLWEENPDKIKCPEKKNKKSKKKIPNKCFPLLISEFNKGGILFIGLNPSLSDDGVKKILEEAKKLPVPKEFRFIKDVESFEWWPEEKRERKVKKSNGKRQYTEEFIKMCNELIDFEKVAKSRYNKYFKKLKEISKYVFGDENKWEHIDLFFYRTTSQDDLKKCINYKEKMSKSKIQSVSLNEFGKDQLEISLGLIDMIEPKVIVVANALSSKIIMYYDAANKKIKIDDSNFEKEGFHRVELSNGKIPILFTSMLSGQRALDLESLRRLKWQIKKAVGK